MQQLESQPAGDASLGLSLPSVPPSSRALTNASCPLLSLSRRGARGLVYSPTSSSPWRLAASRLSQRGVERDRTYAEPSWSSG